MRWMLSIVACLLIGSSLRAENPFNFPGDDWFREGEWDSYNASGISVSSNRVYVVKSEYNQLQVYQHDGTFVTNFWCSTLPYDVEFSGGELYVTDQADHMVRVFSTDGVQLRTFGTNELSNPRGIAVRGGRVFVSDVSPSDGVYTFSTNGTFQWSLASTQGSLPGQFANPYGIAADAMNVYVADTLNGRIQVLSHAGDFLREHVLSPGEVAVDSQPYDVEADGSKIYIGCGSGSGGHWGTFRVIDLSGVNIYHYRKHIDGSDHGHLSRAPAASATVVI